MRTAVALVVAVVTLALLPANAAAAERLCDPAYEDCRQPIIDMIRAETVGIDVSFWFMEDSRYASELISRKQAGVPVRVLMDSEANGAYPGNVPVLQMLKDAGIPMREKSGGGGILHWKLFLFAGQGQVEFSGANFSSEAFVPIEPYSNYIDEVIYFSDDPSIVNSFRTRFDDAWTDTSEFSNYANIAAATPLTRNYPTYPIDPSLQFVPWSSFADRSVNRYNAETQRIDASMYRITDRRHTDALIAAVQRGVAVRLITEQEQYRDPTRLWHAWNVDRLYMAGVQIRFRGHQGLSHEKLTVLHSQGMAIFGSSNWTSASDYGQHEHNLFTTKPWFYQWATDHFDRKWNNRGPSPETQPFVPLPPDAPRSPRPIDGAQNQNLSVTLAWDAGPWAHKYDVYIGTSPSTMTRVVNDVEMGPSADYSQLKTYVVSGLAGGTTYYWQVISRTMANLSTPGPVWNFRTQGAAPVAGSGDAVLWAMRATTHPGWSLANDSTAAGGQRLANANAGAPFISTPLASPAQYFDLGFVAEAGVAYRLWIRGKAAGDTYENDSVYAQFSDSVTSSGAVQWRIGTTSAVPVEIEQAANAGLSGWGWNDTGVGTGAAALGPLVYFASTGPHTLRVQVREDGLSIDQIVLSRAAFLTAAPGAPKNDGTIYTEQGGSTTAPPPPPPPASTLPTGWADADIGGPISSGSASYSAGTFTMSGSGADIWGSWDQFHFVYTSLTGDGSIVARVSSVDSVNAWTKIGVMMRSSLDGGSAQASMFVSAAKGLAFQRRTAAGGTSTHTAGPAATAPYWVKLVRAGSTISAFASPTGDTWTLVGSDTISMPATIYVGLPLTSHVDGSLASGVVTNVTVGSDSATPPPPPPPPPPPAVPAPWVTGDVGSVSPAGSASVDSTSGIWTVKGSGADIWGTVDAFRFVSQPLTGDGEIVARVRTVQAADNWTKAGVMMRATQDPGSAQASMFVSAAKGTAFQRRLSANGSSVHTAGPAATAPYWVKLVRRGAGFEAYASADGVAWTLVGTETIPMAATIDVGLVVTSHNNGTLATATMDNVVVTKY